LVLFGFAVLIGLPIACGYLHLPGGWIVNFPGMGAKAMSDDQMRQTLHVPDGFSLNAYASGVENARMLLFTPTGDLLVSAPRTGTVWLLERDANGDGVSDGTHELMYNLYQPHGLALHDGWLYVAETNAVLRVRFDPATRTVTGAADRIITGLPDGGNHWTRTVHVGPDDKLYVSIGSSCNVCIESDKRRAAIMRFDLDGKNGEIYASGLRNSVDFDWQPGTGAMYATDNGRDLLGDDFPPCELNKIVQGGFYGWPIANADRVPDPDFGAGNDARIAASIPPAHPFGPHVAPLGMTFYRRPPGAAPAAFPADYDSVAFVAEHGSWNRSHKIGYRSWRCASRPTAPSPRRPSSPASSTTKRCRAVPSIPPSDPTARCMSPTTTPARSSASPTGPARTPPTPRRRRHRTAIRSRVSTPRRSPPCSRAARRCGMPTPAPRATSPDRPRPARTSRSRT
jgi:glucose/arabinose dehydrogenase